MTGLGRGAILYRKVDVYIYTVLVERKGRDGGRILYARDVRNPLERRVEELPPLRRGALDAPRVDFEREQVV